jgi:phenylacetate-CoA ligase
MIFYLLKYYLESKLFVLLPDRTLKKIQLKRFRRTFEWAKENSAFYRKMYEEAGILDLEIRTEEDIQKVPIVDKMMMREYQQSGLLTSPNSADFLVNKTSGSNGIPFEIYTNKKGHFTSYVRTFMALNRYNPFKSFVLIGTQGSKEKVERHSFLFYFQKYLGLFRRETISVLTPSEDIIESLKGNKVDVLSSTPTCLQVLTEVLKRNGEKLSVKYVVLSGETLSEELRRDIQIYFQTKIIDVYGCVELPSLAWTKPNGRIYDYALNSAYIEYINHLEINDSMYGELLITNFVNKAMPFIRYKVGDHVQIQNSSKKMGKIEGRIDDVIKLDGDRQIFMYQMYRFNFIEDIVQYKIFQSKDGKLHFQVVSVEGANRSEIEVKVKQTWKKLIGDYPISIEFKNKLPVSATSGKFKRMEVEK